MEFTYRVIRSERRTMALEITPEAEILVRAPFWITEEEIQRFVSQKQKWIGEHVAKMRVRQQQRACMPKLDEEQVRELAEEALREIPRRVAYFAEKMGVSYGRITIRNQKTRWGSCSSKGNLNFNCMLMMTPPEVRDYVVVHELCHIKEMNHSPKFWAEVEKVLPDYPRQKKWLKEHSLLLDQYD